MIEHHRKNLISKMLVNIDMLICELELKSSLIISSVLLTMLFIQFPII